MAEQSKHSPLPWESDLKCDGDGHHFQIISATGRFSGIVVDTLNQDSNIDPETEAENVGLIVRAVNSHKYLLAASKALLDGLESDGLDTGMGSLASDLSAAIAKAEGRAS